MTDLRACTKCGAEYPSTIEFFHKNKGRLDGLHSWCKPCCLKRSREYQKKNPDKHLASKKRYRESHPERVAEQKRIAVAKKPEHYKQQQKRWHDENPRYRYTPVPDELRKRSKPARTPEEKAILQAKEKMYSRNWARNHPDAIKKQKAKYYDPKKYKVYCHNYRARKMNAEGHWTTDDETNMYSEQDGRCAYCGITIYRDIDSDVHVDHIIPLTMGGSNWPSNLTLSCQSCNLSKSSRTVEKWQQVRGW